MTHYTNTSNPINFPNLTDDTIKFPPSIMNERVLELAKQAGLKKEHGADREYIGDFEWRLFAKLIIQDCISQIAMIGVSNCDDDDVVWTVDKSIENIRAHFGVEK